MRFFRSPSKCIKLLVISSVATLLTIQIFSLFNVVYPNDDRTSKGFKLSGKDKTVISEHQVAETSHNTSDSSYKEFPERKLVPSAAAAGGGSKQAAQAASGDGDSEVALAGERMHGLPNTTSQQTFNNSSLPSGANKATAGSSGGGGESKVEQQRILDRIRELNGEQSIRNEDIFGPVSDNSTLAVIVVQVHNRLQYLRQLIISLSQAKDIEKTLIVFSHDFWEPEVNDLVASVDFAKTLQIFYPFSIQTHPHTFPGQSINDCPRNTKKDQAVKMKCTNAEWPDLYGHYREAKFTQTKHHWWWKANRIFNELRATKYFDGYVIFLEEDHYVAEDFLHVMNLLKLEREAKKDKGDILCLGTYLKHAKSGAEANYIELTQWISSKHNMGMAFDRGMWKKIHSCTESFCKFDDYNWDWSLYHISLSCLKQKLQVMLVTGPRVFHIGECGVHHKKSECTTAKVVNKVQQMLAKTKPYLYPQQLQIKAVPPPKSKKKPKGNGGWGDHRDQEMCINLSKPNSTLELQETIDN